MASDDDLPTASSSSDVALPKATVNKFANDVAQSLNIRLTSDTRELIASCCTEFVQLLSSEANDICEKDEKKTITPEHVLRALQQLGLHRFHNDVQDEYERAKADEKVRARANARRERHKNTNLDDAELLRKQEELFALARSDPMAAQPAGNNDNAPETTAETGPEATTQNQQQDHQVQQQELLQSQYAQFQQQQPPQLPPQP